LKPPREPFISTSRVSSLTFHSPAKINLFLAITGRRPDGFHDLVSVVAQLAWGDTLVVEPAAEFSLECSGEPAPQDGTNLILQAAEAFRGATGYQRGARFRLEKRIPVGAGLGGGSSNAATALRALNQLAGDLLAPAELAALAARLGSDCPLFLEQHPVIMRGRGERVEALPETARRRLRGRAILLFKPAFGISTPWAYAQLAAAAPASYLAADQAENRLAQWLQANEPVERLLFNNMEPPAFRKFPALPALLGVMRARFGLAVGMSGSGSACFALPDARAPIDEIAWTIRDSWGESALVHHTHLA
jgi:4-diphosphocytidyl-2-C-methyl-D-erythritol kinase